MNRLMEQYIPLLGHYQKLKHQMLEVLTDGDLAHTFKGSPSLGELCKQIGETEHSYINSFKTYKLNFDYKNLNQDMAKNTSALSGWYSRMDDDLKAILEGFSDEDLDNIRVDRHGWPVPIQQNLDIYKEALLIFGGKAWVHLLALGKALPEQWADWLS
jgi:uncharacterized damage-inducible protein DinB